MPALSEALYVVHWDQKIEPFIMSLEKTIMGNGDLNLFYVGKKLFYTYATLCEVNV